MISEERWNVLVSLEITELVEPSPKGHPLKSFGLVILRKVSCDVMLVLVILIVLEEAPLYNLYDYPTILNNYNPRGSKISKKDVKKERPK
jgi:hypothetical protein